MINRYSSNIGIVRVVLSSTSNISYNGDDEDLFGVIGTQMELFQYHVNY